MRDHIGDELLRSVFSSAAWDEVANALHDVAGVVITVRMPATDDALYASPRCSYCELLHPAEERSRAGARGCLGQVEESTTGRPACFSGLPCHEARVLYHGGTVAYITVSGFISATRERRLLFERLTVAGVPEEAARASVREIPVLPIRRAEAGLKMLCAHAESVVARAVEAGGYSGRLWEIETYIDVGREFLELDRHGERLEQRLLERAVHVVGGTSGVLALMRPGTDLLDVAAATGTDDGYACGDVLHAGDVAEGRVLSNGNSMVTHFHAPDPDSGTDTGQATISVVLRGPDGGFGFITVRGVSGGERASGEALRLLERFATVAGGVLEGTRSEREARRALDGLVHVNRSAKMLGASSTCADVAREATAALERIFDVQVCGIALSAWGHDSVQMSVRGRVTRASLDAVLCDAMGRDVVEEPFAVVRYSDAEGEVVDSDSGQSDAEGPVLSIPFTVGGIVAGYAFAALPSALRFTSADEHILCEVAEHIASALGRASELERLSQDHAATIAALAAALDSAERVEPGHAHRIADYALALGRELGLPAEDLRSLRLAAVVHDIGTLGITPGILGTAEQLTPAEMDEVRRHSVIGAEIVGQVRFLDAVKPAVEHHHERWDGTGYPGGLGGTEIPRLARVLAVADAFDAMTSPRAYRKQISVSEARRELQRGAGTQFDPEAVRAFLAVIERQAVAGITGLFAGETSGQEPRLPA